jgi:hypothetical protein
MITNVFANHQKIIHYPCPPLNPGVFHVTPQISAELLRAVEKQHVQLRVSIMATLWTLLWDIHGI